MVVCFILRLSERTHVFTHRLCIDCLGLLFFLCSIAEAVILSVSSAYISVLEKENRPSGILLRKQTDNINTPLSAILTLNTIAHTMGAAGAGAQAASVFGEAYLGVISAVLTLLILVFLK